MPTWTTLLWRRMPLMAYSMNAIFSLSSDCFWLCGILMTCRVPQQLPHTSETQQLNSKHARLKATS